MKKMMAVVILCVVCLGVLVPAAGGAIPSASEGQGNVLVEIDYGGVCPSRQVQTGWVQGNTALQVLQQVAKVETHPVRHKVFVCAVDGIAGERGAMAWYYTVNGKPAGRLAYTNVVARGDCVKWTYKKDVCSGTVDK